MNQEEKIQPEYDEIDLMDYVRVFLKRRWLIFGIFLGLVIATGLFSSLAPKVYKIDTSLEVGGIGEEVAENCGQLVEKINAGVYGILIREKLNISEADFPKIKVENPKGTRLVKIEIDSANPQKAKSILEEMNKLILADHQEEIKVKKELIEKDIKLVEGKIQSLENNIERTKNKLRLIDEDIQWIENKIKSAKEEKENLEAEVDFLEKSLVYEQTLGTQIALFNTKEKLADKKKEIEDLYLEINSLKRTIEDNNIEINSFNIKIEYLNGEINPLKISLDDIKPTKIVKSPTVSISPVKPKLLFNIIIAGFFGLFMGIFLALGKEWWEKNRVKI